MMAETIIVPWYATGGDADQFGRALDDVARIALRYGASSFAVYRATEDRHRFQQLAAFAQHSDWERYWNGPELSAFRTLQSGRHQVPVLYEAWSLTAAGSSQAPPASA